MLPTSLPNEAASLTRARAPHRPTIGRPVGREGLAPHCRGCGCGCLCGGRGGVEECIGGWGWNAEGWAAPSA